MAKVNEKEFLKISDILKKLGVTRSQFWKMRKAGEVYTPPADVVGG